MEIINVLPEVKEIFEITGFDALLPFQPAREDESVWLNLSLGGFLKKKALDHPDDPMMVYGDEVYTWREIDHAYRGAYHPAYRVLHKDYRKFKRGEQ